MRSQCRAGVEEFEASGVGVPPVVASGVRRAAESKSLRCLIFKFHILIQQCRKYGVAEQWDELGQAGEAGGKMSVSC
ncbi:MAG: hypothetical protein KME22_30420 [Hassallia sp. WJT32-NPBG1]|nr:hypothetical protein [Hassallia sp. WJT32-NPBG1]